jgi:DNA gyrase subunit A
MNLGRSDELVTARLAKEDDEIVMVSQLGMSIRFPLSDVTPRQRAAGGVRGMDIRPKKEKGKRPVRDLIVAMSIVEPDSQSKLFVISKNGFGKLTALKHYRRQTRGGRGLKTFNITSRTGQVAAAEVVTEDLEVYVISEQAQVLRTNLSEISSRSRITQGVTVFKLPKSDAVSSISCCEDLTETEEIDVAALNLKLSGNGKSPKR